MPNLKISQFTNLATSAQSPTYLLPLADSGVSNFKMSLDAMFSNIGANTTSGQVISTTVSIDAAATNPGILVTRGDNKRSVQAWISNASAPGPELLLQSEIVTAQGDNLCQVVFNKSDQGGAQAPATASLGQINFQNDGNTSALLSVLAVGSALIGNNVTFYSTRKGTLSNVGVWGIDDWGTFRVGRNLGPFYSDIQLSDPTKLFMLGDADNLNDSTNTALHIRGTADTMKNLVVQSRASQSVNVFEHRSSANALLLQISPAGLFSPGVAAAVDLATALLPFKDLYLAGSSGTPASFNFRITGTATAARVITLPNATCTLSASASALTSGRVPFVTTDGLITDSANLVWNNASVRLGIGGTPSGGLHIYKTNTPDLYLTETGSSYVARWGLDDGSGGVFFSSSGSVNNQISFWPGDSVPRVQFNQNGGLLIAPSTLGLAPGAALDVRATSAATIGAIVRGAASQTANLQEWQNSAGTVLTAFNSAGAFGTFAGFADAVNIAVGTTTGTKIGTATTQKLAFFNSTPIVQPSSTGVTAGFTAGAGAAVLDDSTFTGNVGSKAYTLGDIVAHLKNLGLIAAS